MIEHRIQNFKTLCSKQQILLKIVTFNSDNIFGKRSKWFILVYFVSLVIFKPKIYLR